jgi:hypothetical protein
MKKLNFNLPDNQAGDYQLFSGYVLPMMLVAVDYLFWQLASPEIYHRSCSAHQCFQVNQGIQQRFIFLPRWCVQLTGEIEERLCS